MPVIVVVIVEPQRQDAFLCGSAEIPLSLQGESGSDMVNKRLTRRNRRQMAGSEGGARLSKHGRITIGVDAQPRSLTKLTLKASGPQD